MCTCTRKLEGYTTGHRLVVPIGTLTDDVVSAIFCLLGEGTNLRLFPVTVHTEELHRRSVRESAFQRVRPFGVVTIIRLQPLLILLNTI